MKLLLIELVVLILSLLISGVFLSVVAILMALMKMWPGMKALIRAWAWGALYLVFIEIFIAWTAPQT
ncbi:MAG TPA: hypothetical protein VLE51_00445 [Candidatus Saccharimonadales bacterium]|nr:hypothetical protein [Candidatus Saccharimonadales bacterium]